MSKKRILTVVTFLLLVCAVFGTSATAQAAKKTKKKQSLSKAKITLSKTSYVYNGKAKKPTVTVKIGKKKLKKNKDYTVTYSSNKSVGSKAKVTIKAKKGSKKYTGKKVKYFKITKASRAVVPEKTSYTAVEGDGAFNIAAKASKGTGTLTYSCATSNVIKVSNTGKVTVVKRGTAVVKISVPATKNYKAASANVTVTINKKPIRTVNSEDSIKNFDYSKVTDSSSSVETKNLTDFEWSVVTKYEVPGLAPTADDDLTKGYIQCNNLCPQGICFAGDYLLTTAYCMDGVHNSCIFIYNKKSGEYLKTLVLKKKSHVGGVAYDGENIWICHSDSKDLQRISYSSLKGYATGNKGVIQPDELELQGIESKPSAVAYNPIDGYIWVAEYVKDIDKRDDGIPKGTPAKMYAYQYVNKKLEPVKQYANAIEEDYLGVITAGNSEESEEIGDLDTDSVVGEIEWTVEDLKKGAVILGTISGGGILTDEAGETVKLRGDDVIVQIGNQRVENRDELVAVLSEYNPGDNITVTALREQKSENAQNATGQAVDAEENGVTVLEGTIQAGERKYSDETVSRVIPDRVQGLTFTDEGDVYFSRSTGRNLTKTYYISQLVKYEATWGDNYKWEETLIINVPPMVEAIESDGDYIYMIFESAAMTYLEGTDGAGQSESPIDKIVSVKIKL